MNSEPAAAVPDRLRDADLSILAVANPEPHSRLLSGLLGLPMHLLLALIRIYQHTVSPILPVLFGPACGCRFAPTCSHYAAEAIRTRGVVMGVALAAIRLLKCTPLHPGGFDPVPPRRSKPRCTRLAA